MSPELKALDLFCGAGGLAQGFRDAGYRIIGGVDFDANAVRTFSHNFPESAVWLEDLSNPTLEYRTWLRNLQGEIDVVIGGPPCQGFSIAGKRLIDDPRNFLYKEFVKTVKLVGPRMVLLENVPTISSMQGGQVKNAIIEDLSRLGYQVSVATLNAADYGVPQARRRTFFVGSKSQSEFDFPAPLSTKVTTFDALSDLPSLDLSATGIEKNYLFSASNSFQKLMRHGSREVLNHELVRHTDKTKSIIRLVPDGGNYKDLPEELQGTRNVNIAWTRMNSLRPCFTIDAGHNHHFHYKENRVPSVRECARIQSFPDRFAFLGNRTSQYRQVGNAVPPLLTEKIALKMKELLIKDD